MTPRTCCVVIGFIISRTLALDESSGRLLPQPDDSDNSSAVEQMINTTTHIPRDYVTLVKALHSGTSGPRRNTILKRTSLPDVAKAARLTSSASSPSSADVAGHQSTDSSTGDAKMAPPSPSATDNVTADQTKPSTTASAATYQETTSSTDVDDADERRPSTSRQEVTLPPPRSAEHDVLNRLLDPEVYDPSIRPGVDEGLSTRVEIDLIVSTVGPVNDRDMEVSISFILRQEWRDPRLTFTDFNRSLTISYMRQASLWVPDLYFIQAREETLHGAVTPNVMIRLAPSGAVLYTQRLSLVVQCRMNLEKFPMDRQACQINMESYSYTTDAVFFVWNYHRKAIRVQPQANVPDFTLVDILAETCHSTYTTGNWTCLKAVIVLKRELGYYIHQTYMPSVLIVMLSWASFWIDHEAVPARISVGLITVLTITTQSSGARAQLPRVPYVKAIDVWMVSCLLFVVAAYIECVLVIVLSRLHKKRNSPGTPDSKVCYEKELSWPYLTAETDIDNNRNVPISSETETGSGTSHNRDPGKRVDLASRIAFPVLFIVFNIVYWLTYTLTV